MGSLALTSTRRSRADLPRERTDEIDGTPTNRAFEALTADADKRAELYGDLDRLWSEDNQATDGTTGVASAYLEVVGARQDG
jgi:hypothetical protein